MRAHFFVMAVLLLAGPISHAQEPATSQNSLPPLSVSDVEHSLKAGVTNTRMVALVKQYGVDFDLTDAVEKELRAAGANDELLLRIARTPHSGAPSLSPGDAPTATSLRPIGPSADVAAW